MSSKAEIAAAYDLDNEFFRLWLDKRMCYTCAVFDRTDDLDAAQEAKLAVLYDLGRIGSDTRVLDVGCGWGGNLEYLAVDRGVREAHGITLSEAQHTEVLRRALPRVTVSCVDYRDYRPPVRFQTIMAMGMVEHVCTPEQARRGEAIAVYRDFFRRAWEWSEPGGHFALQCILRTGVPRDPVDLRELGWATYRMFPGAIAPRMADIVDAITPYWELLTVRTRREDYRRTCSEWRTRLRRHEGLIRSRWDDAVFDEYLRYLDTCVRGFDRRYLSVAQWSLRRADRI